MSKKTPNPNVFETEDSRTIHYQQIQAAADALNRRVIEASQFGVSTRVTLVHSTFHDLVVARCTNAKGETREQTHKCP